ncbi:unnamed protein product [Diplocarpon coronariae]
MIKSLAGENQISKTQLCIHIKSNTPRPGISLHNPGKHISAQQLLGKTNKFNDRDHAGLADGTAAATEHLPRYFAKSGHIDVDPKKTKKNGAGKGGWGVDGEEVQDEGFNLNNARRRSNSSSYTAGLKDFKTKFEHIEHDPELPSARRVNTESSDGSVDEDDKAKRG